MNQEECTCDENEENYNLCPESDEYDECNCCPYCRDRCDLSDIDD